MNKKGLSTVVTTLIIVLLVLVALGVIWAVVGGLIDRTSKTVEFQQKCLELSFDIVNAKCTGSIIAGGNCILTVRRNAGGTTEPVGVMYVLDDQVQTIVSGKITNIPALQTKAQESIAFGANKNPKSFTITPFISDNGQDNICPETNSRTMAVSWSSS